MFNNIQVSKGFLHSDLRQRCPLIFTPQYDDSRGSLSVLESTALPFAVQRVFWIHQVPEEAERGGHAHRTCHELLFALSGSLHITVTDGREEYTAALDAPCKGLLIPAGIWCKLHDFSQHTTVLCLASEPYQAEGYIHSFDNYLQFVKAIEHNSNRL